MLFAYFEFAPAMQMRSWLEENDSNNWPLAAKICTFHYNTSHHSGIKKVGVLHCLPLPPKL
jgi:hypothetical protein